MGSIMLQPDDGVHQNESHTNKRDFNNVYELVTQTSKSHEDKTAVICGNEHLTYAKLEEYSNNLARTLIERNVDHGSLIPICLDRSVDMVVAILGVWKSGAAYVPIEPSLPSDRIDQMMDDADPKFVITRTGEPLATRSEIRVESMSIQLARSSRPDYDDHFPKMKKSDLAYVMYTSGSTGRPKGVEVTHGSVVNLLQAMQEGPGCTEDDILLAITTISFDMAIPELFLPLTCGATTVIARREEILDMPLLIKILEQHPVTILQGTPAIYRMLLDSGWDIRPRLRQIWCGGEALPKALASRLLDLCDAMWNLYGPTEATVYGSMWRVQRGEEVIIGSPILNGHLYVLDEHLQAVPFGQVGELYIGGAGVAKGYRNNVELTRMSFLANPFHGGLMYKTGDAARFVGHMQVSVLGRLDGQIKIRGHRIEPGDIEAAMTTLDEISAAVVISRDDRLIAYYVRKDAHTAQNGGHKVHRFNSELRSSLVGLLPAYMVPAFFVELPTLPITPNGKVDRKALPDAIDALGDGENRVQSRTLEAQLLDIWAHILGHRSFGVQDNFFEVGGDSLRLVRLQKQLQIALGNHLPAHILFEKYTIRALAQHLEDSHAAPDEQSQIEEPESSTDVQEGIAIISTACRLPGDIESPEDFWQLLDTGGDAITTVPEGRWGQPDLDDHLKCQKGGFISSINEFDLSFFGISPREGKRLDPAQYMMLETSWEAFERAGYTMDQLRGSQTGVFIGTSNILSHQGLNNNVVHDLENLDGYTVTGSAAATMSGRLSYILGLQGPAMTVDTACSSSLVATHLACNSLRLRECDVALVGGVSLLTNPGLHVEFERLQGMSPDGRCRSFSSDTEGTGWSEGSVSILIKRLSDARRDGDVIHGVIRGSAVNHDGRSASLTAPSGRAQTQLINKALSVARLQPNDIDYIEAHGTGTRLGDPIEANAIAEVFSRDRQGREPLLIGSAKSNLGHTQAAAGLVGMLKVILAMKHATLPESIHISSPTGAVDWQASNMAPVTKRRSWAASGAAPRRAGASAFGIGGTNAHIILEEHLMPQSKAKESLPLTQALPFPLSGDSDAAVRAQAKRLLRYLGDETQPSGLQDIAFTLAMMRSRFRQRVTLWAIDRQALVQNLLALLVDFGTTNGLGDNYNVKDQPPKLAILFTGQGSQWSGMARDLYDHYPVFRAALDESAGFFDTALEIPLLDIMWADAGDPNAKLLSTTEYGQPAIFAVEASLWRLWQDWGIAPDFVLGHSLGELAAAYAAGIMDLSDACRLVVARGRLMQAQAGDYQMAAIEGSAKEASDAIALLALKDSVEIALFNAPTQIVLSGRTSSVEALMRHFQTQGRKTSIVVDGHAFHSRYVDGMLSEYAKVVESVRLQRPGKIQVVSSVQARAMPAPELTDPQYWVRQAREPVLFCDSVRALASLGANVFLELGPDQVLCGLAAASLSEIDARDSIWLSSMKRSNESVNVSQIQKAASSLHLRNMTVDWEAVLRPYGGERVDLPTYAFQHDYKQPTFTQRSRHLMSNENAPTKDTLDRFIFQVSWKPAESPASGPVAATWGVLILASNPEWIAIVTTTCTQAGIRLLNVEDSHHAQSFDRIICLWDSTPGDHVQSRELMGKALTQLQTAADALSGQLLVWVTRQAVGTGTEPDDRVTELGIGPQLWGLMRTARSEQPHLDLRLIDVGYDATASAIKSALALKGEPEIAVRRESALVPRLERVGPEQLSPASKPLLRTDGAVLITGGLGHLGGCVAEWLISQHGVQDIVLVSRKGVETDRAEQTISKLTALGAKATAIACNVADATEIKQLMATFSTDRPLRGVLHAAGLSDSGVLTSLTPDRCEKVIAPKANGAWLLHDATKHLDLDIFVLFSSVSGVLGMPGLANYAAANTYLDALAHFRRSNGLPATSVAFGMLGHRGGMASRLAQNTQSYLSQYGLDALSERQGLDTLATAMRSQRALTVAAALDLGRVQRYYDEQNQPIPPLLSSLLQPVDRHRGPAPASDKSLQDVVADAPAAQRLNIVLETVRKIIAIVLGFQSPREVDINRSLKAIGIDSLAAVQLRNRLASATGLSLSANIAFAHPSIGALGQALCDQLQASQATPPSSNASSSPMDELDMSAIRAGCVDEMFTFKAMDSLERPRSVFLTGSTGFVGAFILSELVKAGITVYCLVRATSPDEAASRVFGALRHYGLDDRTEKSLIRPVVGDMSRPLLGLSSQDFDDLADVVDAICHSGGLVDWARPFDEYVGPNLVSTHEILRLASRGRPKAIHLVSTISTLPKHMGLNLTEQDLEYGYGTSKFLAERMVAAARWRDASATVYRLPYVTASSTTGHFRRDQGDFLHNLIIGCRELGCFPEIHADLHSVVPVDYVAKTIASLIVNDRERQGQDYDFRNASAPTCNEFFNAIIGIDKLAATIVPFEEWKHKALAGAERSPGGSLAKISMVLDSYTAETAHVMFKGQKLGRNVLGVDEYPIPLMDERFIARYVGQIKSPGQL